MVILHGLPDDVASICLMRLPRSDQVKLRRVSRAWNALLSSDEFQALRVRHNCLDSWLLLVVSRNNSRLFSSSPRLLAFDLKSSTSSWGVHVPSSVEQHLELMGLRCAALQHLYFVLGGASHDDGFCGYCNSHGSTSMLDCRSNSWSQGATMNVSRSYFACGILDGVLYVAGGADFEQTAEAYDVEANRWRLVSSMPFGFQDVESDAVCKGKLFIKGLVQGNKRKVLVYEPKSNSWDCSKVMEEKIMEGEFAAMNDNLYIISKSGYIGKFMEATDGWQQVGQVSLCFVPFGSFSREERVLVVLGRDAFLVDHFERDALVSFKSSVQVLNALPRAFWQWQGAILQL